MRLFHQPPPPPPTNHFKFQHLHLTLMSCIVCITITIIIITAANIAIANDEWRPITTVQELSHDILSPPPTSRRLIEIHAGDVYQYNMPPVDLKHNHTLQLFMVKPYKLREAELFELSIKSSSTRKHTAAVSRQIVLYGGDGTGLPYFQIKHASALHRGDYSLYWFEFDPNGALVDKKRLDFTILVHGLKDQFVKCDYDEECDSGTCRAGWSTYNKCVCSKANPIYLGPNQRCYTGKSLNETCSIDEECQFWGGSGAKCLRGKCRCNARTVSIKISEKHRHCLSLAQLHHRCLYSMQCNVAWSNRYCNATYQCDCLPGYWLENGSCIGPSSSSNGAAVSTSAISIIISSLFVLVLCTYIICI